MENELENETDEPRREILAILQKELMQEEADRKVEGITDNGVDIPSEKELSQITAQREQVRIDYLEAKRSGNHCANRISFKQRRCT